MQKCKDVQNFLRKWKIEPLQPKHVWIHQQQNEVYTSETSMYKNAIV
jgi:hypothetical protein